MTKRTSDPGLEVTSLETHYLAFTTWDYPDVVDCGNPITRPQDPQEMCYQLNQQDVKMDERMFPVNLSRRDGRRERRIAVPLRILKFILMIFISILYTWPAAAAKLLFMFDHQNIGIDSSSHDLILTTSLLANAGYCR